MSGDISTIYTSGSAAASVDDIAEIENEEKVEIFKTSIDKLKELVGICGGSMLDQIETQAESPFDVICHIKLDQYNFDKEVDQKVLH